MTGVQTCALPIFLEGGYLRPALGALLSEGHQQAQLAEPALQAQELVHGEVRQELLAVQHHGAAGAGVGLLGSALSGGFFNPLMSGAASTGLNYGAAPISYSASAMPAGYTLPRI